MKKTSSIYLLSAIALSSCQNQVSTLLDEESVLPVSIRASISSSNQNTTTRYGGTDINELYFVASDQIGLIVSGNGSDPTFSCWTLAANQSSWTSETPLYWEFTSADYKFEAYYPYVEGVDSREDVPMPSLANQSGSFDELSKYDFMTASVSTSYTSTNGGTVDLSFSHALSLLVLKFSAQDDLKDATIDKIVLSAAGLTTHNAYNFDDKSTLTPIDDDSDFTSTEENNTMTSLPDLSIGTSDVERYYILNSISETSILLTLTYTKDEAQYTATGTLSATALNPNTQYTTTISVSKNKIQVGSVAISAWGETISLSDMTISGSQDKKEN